MATRLLGEQTYSASDSPVLDGVAALSANDVWASGTSLWVKSMTRVPGSTQLWAVGMALSSDGNKRRPVRRLLPLTAVGPVAHRR